MKTLTRGPIRKEQTKWNPANWNHLWQLPLAQSPGGGPRVWQLLLLCFWTAYGELWAFGWHGGTAWKIMSAQIELEILVVVDWCSHSSGWCPPGMRQLRNPGTGLAQYWPISYNFQTIRFGSFPRAAGHMITELPLPRQKTRMQTTVFVPSIFVTYHIYFNGN